MRWPIIALALTIFWTGSASAQDAVSAEGFLQDLYSRYTDGRRSPGSLTSRAALVFDQQLVALIRRDQRGAQGVAPFLDHDPICECQDYDLSDVVIRVRLESAATATAEVAFVHMGHGMGLDIDLAKSNGGWRIHDIHGQGYASLAGWLTKSLPPEDIAPAPKPRVRTRRP